MSDKLTFLHAADLHLDSPFKGLYDIPKQIFSEVRESTFDAFDRLIQTAIHKRVDFVLIVGDLFDHKRQSLKAQIHLRKGFEKLQAENIDVFLSYGNHDHLNGNIHPIEYPENVHIFTDESVTTIPFRKSDRIVANIYGFSYENQAVYENKALEYSMEDETIPYHIAMLHGTLYGDQAHDPYASFRLQDLLNEPFDYWALGHIHKRNVLNEQPPIVYPGNIQGRHRNEQGEKGCYYVTLDRTKADLQFVPLQSIEFVEKTVDLRSFDSIVEMEKIIVRAIEEGRTNRRMISLQVEVDEEQMIALDLEDRLPELIAIVNDAQLLKDDWQYIYTYDWIVTQKVKHDEALFFMDEIVQALKEIDVEEQLKSLYRHQGAKDHLERVDTQEILDRAQQLLERELLTRRR